MSRAGLVHEWEHEGFRISPMTEHDLLEVVEIEETWTRKSPIPVSGGEVTLWPSVTETIEFELEGTPPRVPDGYESAGSVILTDRRSGEVWAEIPLRVK